MQQKYLVEKAENKRLILFFTGWSTDWHIIEDITLPVGYDLLCCWDYTNLLSPDISEELSFFSLSKEYEEILVVAWSFGINAAEIALKKFTINSRITGMYAINGSPYPVDDKMGIPVDIFNATFDNLNEDNLKKFRIRIAGGKSKFLAAAERLQSGAKVEELKDELKLFGDIKSPKSGGVNWDYAFISENDRIFPLSNLLEAWKETPFYVITEGDHLPDFQRIFNLVVKDKDGIGKKFEKASKSYADNAVVQNEIAKKLIDLSLIHGKKESNILEIGGGAGILSRKINSTLRPSHFCVIDIGGNEYSDEVEFIKGDVEVEIRKLPTEYFDLVVSGSTMQWLHSPLRVVLEIKRILKPGGFFVFSTFLTGNLKEVSELTGNSLLYLTEDQWNKIIEKTGFETIVSDKEEHVVEFNEVKEIFHHLKSTGVNGLNGKNKTVGELRELINNYPHANGRYQLSYVSYMMALRKP